MLYFFFSFFFFSFFLFSHIFAVSTRFSRPNPSIDELETAVDEFCSLNWDVHGKKLLEYKHPFTKDVKLPNRCLEALYMILLLKDGFGFDGSDRKITLALEVNGQVADWALGFALTEVKFHHHISE